MKNHFTFKYFPLIIFLASAMTLFSQSNQYLHFDREDDFVLLEDGGQFIESTDGLTLAGWFYCDELAYGQGYFGFRGGDCESYLIQLNNGEMECRFINPSGFFQYVGPAGTAIPQVWQHFAWVYDGSEVILYVNGVLKGSSAGGGSFDDDEVDFGIGKSLLGGYNFVFGGRIDEVSVWDKGLSQQEIQDMMDNELTGSEAGLKLYYKFNQGEPGGDNTAITHLICEIGNGERDAELMNFALNGETSNFNGELDPGYQAISFPQIPNHLTTDAPFEIEAEATSGLEVFFEVLEGPATIDGNVVTLSGEAGQIAIQATQPGDDQYDPADPVTNYFMVVDPMENVPNIDARSPLAGDVYVPTLGPIQLATIIDIDYPELFYVTNVHFSVNGDIIEPVAYPAGHFEGWWSPPAYGQYELQIIASNNFGASATETLSIDVVEEASDINIIAAQDIWLNTSNPSEVVEAELPSFAGAFDQVIGVLSVSCPDGGCGDWDRVANVEAQSHDGRWYEIIRYITPYGVPCEHEIDLTDYISLLQGKISFRFNCVTFDNGYLWHLTLYYIAGIPEYPYSSVRQVWRENYPFGDYANLQPVEPFNYTFNESTVAAKLKLVSTGHGWGNNNTGNAAEFYEATHHIWVDGTETFEQYNWYVCNPNPDGCQPQNGTWYHNRAGWCPGTIAQWFDYDITPYVSNDDIQLDYRFYENYVDYCHPNHPDCVSGVTCNDCNGDEQPVLHVACNIILLSDAPIVTHQEDIIADDFIDIHLAPNPSQGVFRISTSGIAFDEPHTIKVYDITGAFKGAYRWDAAEDMVDLTHLGKGFYMLNFQFEGKSKVKKVIIE